MEAAPGPPTPAELLFLMGEQTSTSGARASHRLTDLVTDAQRRHARASSAAERVDDHGVVGFLRRSRALADMIGWQHRRRAAHTEWAKEPSRPAPRSAKDPSPLRRDRTGSYSSSTASSLEEDQDLKADELPTGALDGQDLDSGDATSPKGPTTDPILFTTPDRDTSSESQDTRGGNSHSQSPEPEPVDDPGMRIVTGSDVDEDSATSEAAHRVSVSEMQIVLWPHPPQEPRPRRVSPPRRVSSPCAGDGIRESNGSTVQHKIQEAEKEEEMQRHRQQQQRGQQQQEQQEQELHEEPHEEPREEGHNEREEGQQSPPQLPHAPTTDEGSMVRYLKRQLNQSPGKRHRWQNPSTPLSEELKATPVHRDQPHRRPGRAMQAWLAQPIEGFEEVD